MHWQWAKHFSLNDAYKGVIQYWYPKGFIQLKGSSSNMSPETVILTNEENIGNQNLSQTQILLFL